MEQSPQFCDVAVARWEAVHRQEGGGATWLRSSAAAPAPRSTSVVSPRSRELIVARMVPSQIVRFAVEKWGIGTARRAEVRR